MKYILFFGFYVIFFTELFAQSISPNVSVDNYTGTGNINFPLSTVTCGSLSMPVVLVYDASGLQVNDSGKPYEELYYPRGGRNPHVSANKVKIAAGWHLSVGGAITREIRGLPDDYLRDGINWRQGWLYGTGAQTAHNFVSTSDNNLSNCDDEQTDYTTLNSFGMHIDTEPDVFSFSFGEFSGKFVFDHTTPQGASLRPIHTIPYQDFKVTYTLLNNSITEFIITTNTGIVYKFQPTVTIKKNIRKLSDYFFTSYAQDDLTQFTVEWGLLSVTQPGGSGSITVAYSDTMTQIYQEPKKFLVKKNPGADDVYYDTDLDAYESISIKEYKVPIGVTGSAGSVQFSAEGLQFALNDFRNPIVFNRSEIGGRHFLRSISEVANCVTLAEYKFEYKGVDFPFKVSALPSIFSNAKDFWGYYNNASEQQVSFPKIYVYHLLTGSQRYRLNPIPGNNDYYLLEGANRNVNEDAVTMGLLNKISTPSKGHFKISYESNEYYDETAAVKMKGAGVRVRQIVIHDGISTANDIIKEYEYDANGGRLLYKPSFAYPVPMHSQNGNIRYPSQESGAQLYKLFTFRSVENLNKSGIDKPGVVYETVVEKEPGKGKTIYTYSVPGTNQEISTNDYAVPYNYTAGRSKIARLKSSGICPESGIIENGYSIFPFAESTNYDFERGLLLNKKNYNENGNLVKEIQYSYNRLTKDADPYIIKGIKLESHRLNDIPFYLFGQYTLLTDVRNVVATEKEILFDQTDFSKKLEALTSYFYESANHRLLNRIRTTNSAGIVNQIKIRYLGDFMIPSSGSTSVMALYGMNQDNMYGVPIEKIYSVIRPGDVEKVTAATLTTYASDFIPPQNQKIYYFPSQVSELKIVSPISNFSPTTISTSGNGINNLVIDSRYKVVTNYLDRDKIQGIPIEVGDDKRNIQAIIMESGNLKKADITNVRLSEIAFSGFTKTGDQNFSFADRHGSSMGYGLTSSETLTRIAITKNMLDPTYIFSCWIKTENAGVLSVELSDGVHISNSTIDYSSTNNNWKFYQCKIPVNSLGATFDATIRCSSSIVVDNHILLYPSSAAIRYYTYNGYGKGSDTDMNGNTLFYSYDMFKRLTHVRDQDNNILKRITYPILPNRVISAEFHSLNEAPTAGNPVYFLADDRCTPGSIYTWDFGDGSTGSGSSNPNHTYQEPGTYTITLTTSHPEYGGSTKSISLVVRKYFYMTICNTSGPISYSICNGNEISAYSTCDANPIGTPGANLFTVNVSQNTSANAVIYYRWQILYNASSPYWTDAPDTDNHTNTFQRYIEAIPQNSYQVRCIVQVYDTNIPGQPPTWQTTMVSDIIRVDFLPCN